VSAALSAPPVEGCQEPRFLSVPPAASHTAAEDALEFVASVGVLLDPWQKLCVRHALAEAADGRWAAFEFALMVARQNGKGEVIMALELAKLYLFRFGRPPLILHSAHLFPTAQEAFRRIREVVDGSDVLRKEVKRISAAHGEEGIELRDGARLRFMARTISGAGRGFSPTDLYLDEVFHLPVEAVSANMPALSAQANPQIGYFCSAGFPNSDVLWRIVERGRGGDDPQLAYLEWSVGRSVELADRGAWLQANPAVGYRPGLTLAAISREYAAMPGEDFGRERLGIWADTGGMGILDFVAWQQLEDSASVAESTTAFAVEVNLDRTQACIGAAGPRADGAVHVEVVDAALGLDRLIPRCVELNGKWAPSTFVIAKDAPAASLAGDMEDAGLPVVVASGEEIGTACADLVDAVRQRGVFHGPQPALDDAVKGAKTKPRGDGAFTFTRVRSGVDITALYAVTLAAWGHNQFGVGDASAWVI